MQVTIIDITRNPVDLISRAMGTCYGKDDSKQKRVENAWKMHHDSVFEHAKVTVRIEGISRACSHQLVRHRMASFCQESQRYVKIDVSNDDWYVKPHRFDERWMDEHCDYSPRFEAWYCQRMMDYAENYTTAINCGVPAEDARYLLPNACKTNIVMTMNLRELYHFLHLREDSKAQWEIRELAETLRGIIHGVSDQWKFLMELDKQE